MKEHSDDVPHVVSPIKAQARGTESNFKRFHEDKPFNDNVT